MEPIASCKADVPPRLDAMSEKKAIMPALLAAIVLASAAVGAQESSDCRYVSNEPGAEFAPQGPCASVRDGRASILPEHLRRVRFPADGLATVLIGGQFHYLNRAGALLPVIHLDNGADFFSEGLVRSPVGGRIAFYDRGFNQVIGPRYDWAWPFAKGRALVCVGCLRGPPDDEGHRDVSGGTWGYIDRQGVEIVPVELTEAQATGQGE